VEGPRRHLDDPPTIWPGLPATRPLARLLSNPPGRIASRSPGKKHQPPSCKSTRPAQMPPYTYALLLLTLSSTTNWARNMGYTTHQCYYPSRPNESVIVNAGGAQCALLNEEPPWHPSRMVRSSDACVKRNNFFEAKNLHHEDVCTSRNVVRAWRRKIAVVRGP